MIGSTNVHRVPVEHRLLGLDKRSFPYALFVIAVFLLRRWSSRGSTTPSSGTTRCSAGDQLALADTISFTPTTGWNVERGFRVGEGGSAVTSGARSSPATG